MNATSSGRSRGAAAAARARARRPAPRTPRGRARAAPRDTSRANRGCRRPAARAAIRRGAAPNGRWPVAAAASPSDFRRRDGRQAHGERRAAAIAVARGVHGAAVQLGEPPHQREADTETAARAVDGVVRLHEQVEDLRQHVGRDADALVGDAQHGVVAFAPDEHADDAVAARELERIGNQVADDLLEAHRVAVDPDGLGAPGRCAVVVRIARRDGR